MDIAILLWLQGLREALPSFVEQFFLIVSSIANSSAIILIPCVLYWCLDKRVGTKIMFSFSMGAVCNQLIKNTACCYRPWIRDAAIHPTEAALDEATGYSFPSGHTQTSVCTIGALGWWYRKRWWALFAGCVVFVLLVALSRLILGVHTPQDVVVGLIEGILIVVFSGWLTDWVDEKDGRDRVVLIVSLVVTVAFVAFVLLRPYPIDYDSAGNVLVDPVEMQVDCFKAAGAFGAAVLGWYLERALIGFEVDAANMGWKRHAVRIVVGIVLVVAFYAGSKLFSAVIVDERWFSLVKYFLVVFAGVFLAPLVFSAIERRVG
ncbi:MAG: phosphatase PAP2 family protein [Coriobacteriales bacterium]|nr:phosphatase PAP2 family protein [Coriobacteriales bacterium]